MKLTDIRTRKFHSHISKLNIKMTSHFTKNKLTKYIITLDFQTRKNI